MGLFHKATYKTCNNKFKQLIFCVNLFCFTNPQVQTLVTSPWTNIGPSFTSLAIASINICLFYWLCSLIKVRIRHNFTQFYKSCNYKYKQLIVVSIIFHDPKCGNILYKSVCTNILLSFTNLVTASINNLLFYSFCFTNLNGYIFYTSPWTDILQSFTSLVIITSINSWRFDLFCFMKLQM